MLNRDWNVLSHNCTHLSQLSQPRASSVEWRFCTGIGRCSSNHWQSRWTGRERNTGLHSHPWTPCGPAAPAAWWGKLPESASWTVSRMSLESKHSVQISRGALEHEDPCFWLLVSVALQQQPLNSKSNVFDESSETYYSWSSSRSQVLAAQVGGHRTGPMVGRRWSPQAPGSPVAT